MQKEERNIIINENNYQGYAELYEMRIKMSLVVNKYKNIRKKVIKVLACMLLMTMILSFIPFTMIQSILCFMRISIGTIYIANIIGIKTCSILECSKLEKIGINQLAEKYPYLDFGVKSNILKESLENYEKYVKRTNFRENYLKELDNYLIAEKIKYEYLRETKYDKYVVSPKIEEEELEKVKVKVKSLTR